tara:strand:+ start:1258 stop:1935 length:678 start_codon:yes stop_codon:yes gene_type:complete
VAFEEAWSIVKDFRYLLGELHEKQKAGESIPFMADMAALQTKGGFDTDTKDIFANLNARDLHIAEGWPYRETDDEEKEQSLLETLIHESDHLALDRPLQEVLQPRASRYRPVFTEGKYGNKPYEGETWDDLKEEFNDRYLQAQEYAVQGLDTMRRMKGPREPGLIASRIRPPNKRFSHLMQGYGKLGYDLKDLVELERKTASAAMGHVMGRRARENARRMMDDDV